MATSLNLREEIPADIVKGGKLEKTMNDLYKNFKAGEERNAELINDFFDQKYFTGEESLISKLIEAKPDIKFEDIKDEGINLAILLFNDGKYDFKLCLDKINNDDINKAFIQKIHDKVQAKIGIGTPYDHFDDPTECAIPGDTNVLGYFEKVVNYLTKKESATNGKKVLEVLKEIDITNDDLNTSIPAGEQIPLAVNLTDGSIPENTKNIFDTLLAFEIGKEADRTINIADNFSKDLQKLLTNSIPAINTIIGESNEYKYNESKLGNEYQGKLKVIQDDINLNEKGKDKKIKELKWEYYLSYLKAKNSKIGNALEQLYKNDFDYSKVEPNVLKDYFDKVGDIRLKMLFDNGINELIKLHFGNVDEFKNFYKDLTDPTKNYIELHDVNKVILNGTVKGNVNIPIQKKLIEGKNGWLKDIDQFGKNAEKSFDAFPMEFTIKKSDINTLNITIEDKTKLLNLLSKFDQGDKYEIKGENIGILIYLFFIINSELPITKINSEKQKEVEKVFGQAKNHKDTTQDNKPEDNKPEEHNEGNTEYTTEKFKEDIEKLGPGKFENGSEIWLPMGDSELPGGGYQWMKVKISDIDMKKGTFKGTVFGGELKFNDKLEGKSKKFKMDKEFFDNLEKISKDSKKVWLLPDSSKSDFNSFKDSLNGKLGTSELVFPIAGIARNGKNFMQKIADENGKEKEVEVKYFGASSDDKSTYKIDYNPNKKSFTVTSSFNGDEKGKDGKSTKKRFSYKRDMDWNNFLIFFTQKGLTPQTEEEANSAIARQDQEFKMVNGGHWKLNWFSINNIKNVFKTLKGNIKKKIDEYNKAQDDKLQDIIIGDWGLYSKLAGMLGFIPSMKEGLGELEQEYYNERDNRTRKKIEYYLKKFQADPDFGTTFDQVPPHAKIQGGISLQQIVLNRVANAQDRMGDPGIYQAAALLLANFEKGGSPYRGLAAQENSGLWVKALLGKAHYEQFMRDKAALIKARDAAESGGDGDKKGLNETLAVCEWKYIINNIRGSYGGLIVGSYEKRGIPGEDGTNYIDNPAKRLLSDQFANKLESAYQGRFTKDSINSKLSKFKNNNSFDEMENEFGKSGSTRYQTGEAALRRMIDLSTNDNLRKRMKKHFLTYLLSGALDVNCDPGLKKQVYGRAKPMMFVPGLLVKEAGVAENIAILLDDATNGDFSKNITHYFHRDKQLDGSIEFKKLQGEINEWLTDEKFDKLDDYFSKLPTKDLSKYAEPKRSILKKYQDAMSASNRDEADRGILENPKVVSNGLLSSVEVVKKRMSIKNGEFDGKDIDETNNMKEFRKNVTKDINNKSTEPRQVAFVLDKFFSRFGIDNQQIYEWIRTADYYDKNRGSFSLPYKGIDLNMGNIGDKEINSILWYAFEGNAWKSRGLGCDRLPDELFSTLEAFRKYFSKAFYDGTLLDKYVIANTFKPTSEDTLPLLMGSRDVYDQAFTGDGDIQTFTDTSEEDLFSDDDSKKRKAKKNKTKELLKSSDFINSDIVNIEKQLKKNLGGTSGQFPTVTSSTSRTLREEYLINKLAA